jgi:hypothetical protein
MNIYARHHSHIRPTANRREPLSIFALILALFAVLSVAGCTGLAGPGKPGAKSISTSFGTLAANATDLNFGNVAPGSTSPQTLTLTNTGTAAVTISQATATGAGFSLAAGMSAVSIAAGQSHAFQVQFAPTSAGSASGSISIASDATDSLLAISLNGSGMTTVAITAQPVSQTVVVGQPATFSVAATGTSPMTYQWKKNGTAISGAASASYTTPATAASDNSAQFTVTVANSVSNATSSAAALTVVNSATPVLNASKTSLSFSSVDIGSDIILPLTLTNGGNSDVSISNVTISGAGYSAYGVQAGQILTPGQTAALNVVFAPAGTGLAPGSITLTSNAGNSPESISLSGTGVQAATHSVTLTWATSASVVSGYNGYRSTTSGGPYAKLNSAPVGATTYVDATVQAGQTYYFVVTSVDSSGVESADSSEVLAIVP